MTIINRVSNYISRKVLSVAQSIKYSRDKNSIVITYCDTKSCQKNFGDALNPLLVSKLSNKKLYSYRSLFKKPKEPVYSVIGSILDDANIPNMEVWGSGFIKENGNFKTKPSKVHAVRGPLSREIVLNHGIDCPEVYGDPALLCPLFFKPQKTNEFKLGLIPHFIDKNNEYISKLIERYPNEVLLIDIEDKIENVIKQINRCQNILSSSLHGVIVGDAYDIPSYWLELSDKVIGKGFKFRDYMLSIGRDQMEPIILKENITLETLLSEFLPYEINFDKNKLLKSCPFLDKNYGEIS